MGANVPFALADSSYFDNFFVYLSFNVKLSPFELKRYYVAAFYYIPERGKQRRWPA